MDSKNIIKDKEPQDNPILQGTKIVRKKTEQTPKYRYSYRLVELDEAINAGLEGWEAIAMEKGKVLIVKKETNK